MTTTAKRWERVMLPNYRTPTTTLARGQGAHVWDTQGRHYLDLLAGIAVNILGHAHPLVVEAVREQIGRLGHTSNLYANDPALRLCERLHARTAGHRALLVNSGTEANEFALKVVRRHAHAMGAPEAVTVAFHNAFHGRTMGALALTGQPKYHEGFAPLPGAIVHVPYNDEAALEAAFANHRVAGVFFEAVQGEGGVTPATPGTARALSRLCRDHGALLVADEVQTGVGRTGRFFGYEHLGLKPDVVTMAKGLGGGLPVGACLVAPQRAALMGPGSHGCTFGGNPVAAAAANAVLDVYEKERLDERAASLGTRFMAALSDAVAPHGATVRGLGLLLGVALPKPAAGHVVRLAAGAGVLVGQAGDAVTRLAPPLIVGEDDLLSAAGTIGACVKDALSA